MREHPTLFSAPMVRAILAGTKTQTRRLVKGPRGKSWNAVYWQDSFDGGGQPGLACADICAPLSDPPECFGEWRIKCPFGVPGDRLWVRETWADLIAAGFDGPEKLAYFEQYLSRDGTHEDPESKRCRLDYGVKWRPSIHMPRWASRITLEVQNIRVERLQEITEEDAQAEGVTPFPHDLEGDCWTDGKHRTAFEYLWDQINRDRATWSSNPWVWVVEFKRAESQVTP